MAWPTFGWMHLHVIAGWTEPLEQKDGEHGNLDADQQNHNPRYYIERLWERTNDEWWLQDTSLNQVPRKALGEMMPVRLATVMAMPVSRKGTVKSTNACRSELILIEVTTMSARWFNRSAIKPFHVPF